MRTDIAFTSHGTLCRGWLYHPERTAGPLPAVVMSPGFSAVVEQGLQPFAERFAAAGLAALVFDYRNLGRSDGPERGRIVPQEQLDDLRAALGFLAAQPGVDPTRLGLWGSSYSGGHVLFLGALDPRVKVVVAQVPAIALAHSLVSIAGREGFAGYLQLLAQDHATRNAGGAGATIPIVAPPGEPCVLATPDSRAWFEATAAEGAPWLNRTTLESVARMAEYLPAALIDLVTPKPLLMIAAAEDALIPITQVREAFARAGEPKRLEVLDGGHFDLYPGRPLHERAATLATEWLVTHL